MGCGDVRLLRTIGGVDFTRQERATLNKLTMPAEGLRDQFPQSENVADRDLSAEHDPVVLVLELRKLVDCRNSDPLGPLRL